MDDSRIDDGFTGTLICRELELRLISNFRTRTLNLTEPKRRVGRFP